MFTSFLLARIWKSLWNFYFRTVFPTFLFLKRKYSPTSLTPTHIMNALYWFEAKYCWKFLCRNCSTKNATLLQSYRFSILSCLIRIPFNLENRWVFNYLIAAVIFWKPGNKLLLEIDQFLETLHENSPNSIIIKPFCMFIDITLLAELQRFSIKIR